MLTSFEIGTLILTSGLLLATTAYVYVSSRLAYETKILAIETEKMRKTQINPKMSIHLSSSIVQVIFKNLVIENIGNGPAYNVKFKLNKDFTLYDGRELSEIRIIKDGIPYLPPKEKFEFCLTDTNYLKYADECLIIEATYKNSDGESFIEKFILDFSLWKNLKIINIDGINQIVDKLENINTSLNNLKKN